MPYNIIDLWCITSKRDKTKMVVLDQEKEKGKNMTRVQGDYGRKMYVFYFASTAYTNPRVILAAHYHGLLSNGDNTAMKKTEHRQKCFMLIWTVHDSFDPSPVSRIYYFIFLSFPDVGVSIIR